MSTPTEILEGKTLAIVSYIGLIGFIIALALNAEKRNPFARFHMRQSLMIVILAFLAGILMAISMVLSFTLSAASLVGGGLATGLIGGLLSGLLSIIVLGLCIGIFVLWIIGIVAAANGEEKTLPLVGGIAQGVFGGL